MIVLLLILTPLVAGLLTMAIKHEMAAKIIALTAALGTLALAVNAVTAPVAPFFDLPWLVDLGSRFTLKMDGMGKMLVLLTALSFPLIFIAVFSNRYEKAGSFFGLMLLTQAGLMGVFLAADVLLFYFFWELALIPVYFLASIWGGEKRIAVTFKFFVYTFIGSLLMLVGILYVYFHAPEQSFSMQSFLSVQLSTKEQAYLFWLFFIAFAIKMPIFPFHTWQPDAYEQSSTATTMVMSGVMVKMGLFAVVRWLLPLFPAALSQYSMVVIILSVTGMIYASLIAIRQDDIKRLIAYSSIAHIGLMCAAIFTHQQSAYDGMMIQMFNHGINVIGLWILADVIEQQFGTRKLSDLGGLAQKSPAMAVLLVVMALANVALPLTNAFVGEFLMFSGLFKYNYWIAATAGISIILAAVYTLNMVQKIIYGELSEKVANAVDLKFNTRLVLTFIALLVIALGVYPQPLINLTHDTVAALFLNK